MRIDREHNAHLKNGGNGKRPKINAFLESQMRDPVQGFEELSTTPMD
jgi:hypothetical protein